MKKASDIQATILNAVIANTRTKIVFRMADPDDAAYLARVLHLGFLNYAEWKPGTERPVAVGSRKEIVRTWSEGETETDHTMQGESVSVARGRARSLVHGSARAVSSATSVSDTHATGEGSVDADGTMTGNAAGDVDTNAFAVEPFSGILAPNIIGQNLAHSTSLVATNAASHSRALSRSTSDAQSRGHTKGVADIMSEAVGEIESEVVGEARSRSSGRSVGTTRNQGQGEKAPVAGQIVVQDANTILAKEFIGQTVYAPDKAKIGSISDLILSKDAKTVEGFVIGVGGFLGIGEKSVALKMDRLQIGHNADGGLQLTMDVKKEELTNAPTFKSKKDQDAEKQAAERPRVQSPTMPPPKN